MSEYKPEVWVVVAPDGLLWVGRCIDEGAAWDIALGWPSAEEIESKKANGFYAAPAEVTWRKP